MIAAHHLAALGIVLALACVPTVIHSYIGQTVSDRRALADLPVRLNGVEGRGTGRAQDWVLATYGTTDFIERRYGSALTLFVARSYDAKSLYHHPELGVGHADGYDRAVVVRRPDRPDVPIFTLQSAQQGYSAYALLYEDRLIEHPMRFQLRHALSLLIRPKAPMTLFFVRGKVNASSPPARASVEDLLLAAVDGFAAQGR